MKNTIIGAIAILCLTLGLQSASAYNRDDYKKLIRTRSCPNCDLSNSNLAGSDFRRANLQGINFKNANLAGVDFSGANLTGANMRGANLNGTKLNRTIWIDGKRCSRGSISKCADKRAN